LKQFALFVLAIVLAALGWRDFVGSGRFLAYLDAHPHRKGTASMLFYLGSYYEVFQKDQKALEAYERVADRYPNSRYGEKAQFGVGSAWERMRRYDKAREEYEEFLERYPGSRFAVSVRNNVEILKTR
jgi:TolA-binding protein